MKTITAEMVQHLIGLAETAKSTNNEMPVQNYIDGLEPEQQAEFLALMWLGRNDAVDGPIPFVEHVEYAKTNLDHAGSYMSEKSAVLADYLRNGIKLMKDRGEL